MNLPTIQKKGIPWSIAVQNAVEVLKMRESLHTLLKRAVGGHARSHAVDIPATYQHAGRHASIIHVMCIPATYHAICLHAALLTRAIHAMIRAFLHALIPALLPVIHARDGHVMLQDARIPVLGIHATRHHASRHVIHVTSQPARTRANIHVMIPRAGIHVDRHALRLARNRVYRNW
jgi:hypothetical protein